VVRPGQNIGFMGGKGGSCIYIFTPIPCRHPKHLSTFPNFLSEPRQGNYTNIPTPPPNSTLRPPPLSRLAPRPSHRSDGSVTRLPLPSQSPRFGVVVLFSPSPNGRVGVREATSPLSVEITRVREGRRNVEHLRVTGTRHA